jgi:RNA polymerase sigma-70 factor (ECF subfamily)
VENNVLICGIKSRDISAFDLIFKHYYSGLCEYASHFLFNSETAEDIVQEVFVTIWEKADKITFEGSLKSYIVRMVRNRCLDYLKHEKVKQRYNHENSEMSLIEEPDYFAESELELQVKNALDQLPKRCKEIFIKSRFEGMDNNAIAEFYGISKGTVEVQVSHALKKLRKLLVLSHSLFSLLFM